MRLFIALQIDDETLDKLVAAQNVLLEHAEIARPSTRENLHMTLKFLGHIEDEDLFSVEDALDYVHASATFDLTFDHAGWFSAPRTHKSASGGRAHPFEGFTWWMGAQPNEGLDTLQRDIEGRMVKLGLEPSQHPFKPHVTLARRVILNEESDLEPTAALLVPQPFTAHVSGFSLMESRQEGENLVYERICGWE